MSRTRRLVAALSAALVVTACTTSTPPAPAESAPTGSAPSASPSPVAAPWATGPEPSFALTLAPGAGEPLFPYDVDGETPRWPPPPGTRRIAADGAFESDYGERYGGAGWQFSPVGAAQYCYQMHNALELGGGDVYREAVVALADGLLARGEQVPTGLLWRYGFPQPTFGAGPGWISGMAQGLAIGCFASAYEQTRDPKYTTAARQALGVLTADFGDNGTAAPVPGGVYYEEVAGAGSEPTHILNGMVYALMGLWLHQQINPEPEFQEALDAGVAGVRSVLDEYYAPGVSLYDLGIKRLARIGQDYNVVHVAQLQWLHELTGDPAFGRAALDFMAHERNPVVRATSTSERSDRGAANLDGSGSYFSAGDTGPVTITLELDGPTVVDRVMVIGYSEEKTPGSVRVRAGDVLVEQDLDSRFSQVDLDPVETEQLTVELTPRNPTLPLALALLAVSGPDVRSLTATSSDTRSYRDGPREPKRTVPEGSPLNVDDDTTDTVWRSDVERPWLLVDLQDLSGDRISLAPCADGGGAPVEAAFSPDLRRWSPAQAVDQDAVDVPEGARYLHLSWPQGDGCLAELEAS